MTDNLPIQNQIDGEIHGPVVQAGSIQQVSLFSSHQQGKPSVPRQLPSTIWDFTGRAEYLAALDKRLPNTADDITNKLGIVVISALEGTAGVGKTALAVHWSHRVQHCFPGGTLYMNLRGYGPGEPARSSEVLDDFLRALGVSPDSIPPTLDARAGMYRSLVAHKQVLIVLDNASTSDQVRPLIPGSAGCLVLVTSRSRLTGLAIAESAFRMTLDLLTMDEATSLIERIVGRERINSEDGDAVTELIRLCVRLPLALRIAAHRVAASPTRLIADIVAELADERSRLDALSNWSEETTAVRTVFSWSYKRLEEYQALLFRRLGLHPGPQVNVHASAVLTGVEYATAERLLDILVDMHLVEPLNKGRYRFHDLLRTYAYEKSMQEDSLNVRKNAIRRLTVWYLQTAAKADLIVFPGFYRPIILDPKIDAGLPLTFSGREDALEWFDFERLNLVSIASHASECGHHELALQIAEIVTRFFNLRANWGDALKVKYIGLAAARHCADQFAEARMLHRISEIFQMTRRFNEAVNYSYQALDLARHIGDEWAEFASLNCLGITLRELGRKEEALAHCEAALRLFRDEYGRRAEGVIRSNIGAAHASLGRFREAIQNGEHGLEIRRQSGDRWGVAVDLQSLGQAWEGSKNHSKAIELYSEAASVYSEVGAHWQEGKVLTSLGYTFYLVEDLQKAEEVWQRALTIFDKLGDPDATKIRDVLGILNEGGSEIAEDYFRALGLII